MSMLQFHTANNNNNNNNNNKRIKGKGKGKGHPRTDHEGPEGIAVYLYTFFNLRARWGG